MCNNQDKCRWVPGPRPHMYLSLHRPLPFRAMGPSWCNARSKMCHSLLASHNMSSHQHNTQVNNALSYFQHSTISNYMYQYLYCKLSFAKTRCYVKNNVFFFLYPSLFLRFRYSPAELITDLFFLLLGIKKQNKHSYESAAQL